jgi:putative transposase
MAKLRRSFSVEQKLHIIQEADQIGITQTLRKHNLSHSVFQRWKHQFNSGGVRAMKPQYHKVDPEIRVLQEENARLEKIIGNQALELEFKTELLKKSDAHYKGRKASLRSIIAKVFPLESCSNGLHYVPVVIITNHPGTEKV